MFWITGHAVLSIIGLLIGAGIFAVSIFVVLRQESSPFRYGIWRGLGICAGFQVVITILMNLIMTKVIAMILLMMALGIWGFVIAAILFFVGMNRIFEADFVESIMIVVANMALAKGVEVLLIKMFVSTVLPYSY